MIMKKILSMIVAGSAGGLIVLVGLLSIDHYSLRNRPSKDAHFASRVTALEVGNIPGNFVHGAEEAMPAVVHISVKESSEMAGSRRENYGRRDPFSLFFGDDFFGGPRSRAGKGSGVIFSDDGYIVTNNHVIEMADEFEVTLFDDRKFKAVLIGSDPRTDIAVLKIDADNLPILKFADSDEIKVGEWVLAVGNPFDLTSTVTAGIISAKGRHKILQRNDAIEDFIQTDAVVNPGNSGGALVNAEGRLIGINTAIASATGSYAGYSFAIPSNMVEPVINNIVEFGGPRVSLGIYVATIENYEEYEGVDLEVDEGLVVSELIDGGVAQYAGIIPGDIIVKIDKFEIKNVEALVEVIGSYKIGDEVELSLIRNKRMQKIKVRLKT